MFACANCFFRGRRGSKFTYHHNNLWHHHHSTGRGLHYTFLSLIIHTTEHAPTLPVTGVKFRDHVHIVVTFKPYKKTKKKKTTRFAVSPKRDRIRMLHHSTGYVVTICKELNKKRTKRERALRHSLLCPAKCIYCFLNWYQVSENSRIQ